MSETSAENQHCSGSLCDPEGLSAHERAKSAATTSLVAIIAGGVLFTTGIVLLLTAPPREPLKD
jgi:hypothetical protein